MLELAESLPLEESLKLYRQIRSITPALNKVTKKYAVMGGGMSTLSKIRDMLDYADTQVPGGIKSICAFGISNYKHAMCYHPKIRVCYDTDVRKPGNYFVKGDLRKWKSYVRPGEFILSDCSLGESEGSGLDIPEDYYDIYSDMVKHGHPVLFKFSKNGGVVKRNLRVDSVCYYREHNMEAFALVTPWGKDVDRYELGKMEYELEVKRANDERMRLFICRDYDVPDATLRVREAELTHAMNVLRNAERGGKKAMSVVCDIIGEFGSLKRGWNRLCFDKEYQKVEFEDFLTLDIDLPCVLLDMGTLASDHERLIASFFHNFEMEFVEEFGWVAVEGKN